ncbi:MAG: hypothetical protein ACHQ03_07765 [Candidatus Bathyarchaeia archaeon]
MESETKRIILSNVFLLLIFLLTFYLYYQPQLEQQKEELELLKKQVEAQSLLQVTLSPSDGWVAVDDHACAKVSPNATLTFQIANTGGVPVTIIKLAYLASNWESKSGGPISIAPNTKILPGDSTTGIYSFKGLRQDLYGQPGEQTDFSITIVTVELPVQVDTYCIVYS